ncbi:MAG: hypothetical protein ACRC46_00320 [Thermoguttaceae bacterium]
MTEYPLNFYKDVLEATYYVAFVFLTLMLVWLQIQSYLYQTKKHSELLCKVVIQPHRGAFEAIVLEIYNDGNSVAKNVKVFCEDHLFQEIAFIKPQESYCCRLSFTIQNGLTGGSSLSSIHREYNKESITITVKEPTRTQTLQLGSSINTEERVGSDHLGAIARSVEEIVRVLQR